MTFNGLKGAQLAAWNYLIQADLSQPIYIRDIESVTCYAYVTLLVALKELEEMGMIERRRTADWQPYHYSLKEMA